jgi:hypothetical protein
VDGFVYCIPAVNLVGNAGKESMFDAPILRCSRGKGMLIKFSFVDMGKLASLCADAPAFVSKLMIGWDFSCYSSIVPESFGSIIVNDVQKHPGVKTFPLSSWWLSIKKHFHESGEFLILRDC